MVLLTVAKAVGPHILNSNGVGRAHVARDLVEVRVPRAAAAAPDVDVRVWRGELAHQLAERRRVARFEVPERAQRRSCPSSRRWAAGSAPARTTSPGSSARHELQRVRAVDAVERRPLHPRSARRRSRSPPARVGPEDSRPVLSSVNEIEAGRPCAPRRGRRRSTSGTLLNVIASTRSTLARASVAICSPWYSSASSAVIVWFGRVRVAPRTDDAGDLHARAPAPAYGAANVAQELDGAQLHVGQLRRWSSPAASGPVRDSPGSRARP